MYKKWNMSSQVEAVTELLTEDGKVRKTVTRAGDGPVVPEHANVLFHYNCYIGEDAVQPFDSTWLRNVPHRSSLEHVTVPGLMIAMRTMRRGERCRVVMTHEYGYGAMGCPPRIPPMATVVYDVHILSFIVPEEDDGFLDHLHHSDVRSLPFDTLYEMCALKHRNGNRYYEAREFATALGCYALASRKLGWTCEPEDEERRDRRKQLLITLHANEAQCALRMRNPERAVDSARRALSLDEECVKALYRCGVGLRLLGDIEEAASMQRRALALEPGSHHVQRELFLVEQVLRTQRSFGAALCCTVMHGMGNSEGRTGEVTGEERAARQRRLAIEYAVQPTIRYVIHKALEALAKAPAGTQLPLDADHTREEIDYVRLLCGEMGFTLEPMADGGHNVRRPGDYDDA